MPKIEDRLVVLESQMKGHEYLQPRPVDLALLDTHNQYQIPPHIKLLNEKLLQVANGEVKRLMVLLPPRHGKSTIISHYFPAWYLAHNPTHRVILASYSEEFASSWGRKVHNTIK